jgi:predicted amidophosphoribosyltransferase
MKEAENIPAKTNYGFCSYCGKEISVPHQRRCPMCIAQYNRFSYLRRTIIQRKEITYKQQEQMQELTAYFSPLYTKGYKLPPTVLEYFQNEKKFWVKKKAVSDIE